MHRWSRGRHAHAAEREVAVQGVLKGAPAAEAEVAALREERALHRVPPDRDIGDHVTAATLRTLHPHRRHIRAILCAATVLLVAPGPAADATSRQGQVWPGVDVLIARAGDGLAGKRVGVITHRAAAGVGGWPTATLLAVHSPLRVVALFVPEHGFAGDLPAGVMVPHTQGEVPIYSLYGLDRSPTAQMLADLDVLVFDLQDVGARAYTYISTMALAMQAAALHNKLFVVLDRPNPLGGERVDGPVLDPAFASFIGIYPLPAVHGMTIGELALLFNQEFGINARLAVVPMKGWEGRMQWEDTGLLWFRPSPNIPSPIAAQLHAATGMLEGTNLSVGAGSGVPFETVTAPWVHADRLAARLNAQRLPGVRFEAIWVGPRGQRRGGVRLVLTDTRQFRPATTAAHILTAVQGLYPDKLHFSANWGRYTFDLVWGTDTVRKAIRRGEAADRIVAGWADGLQRFQAMRQRYLIYPRGTPTITR